MVKFVVGNSTNKLLFHIIYWIGSGMQVICAIILYFFTDDKYDYCITKNNEIYNIHQDSSINVSHIEDKKEGSPYDDVSEISK